MADLSEAPFSYTELKNGSVHIAYEGKVVTMLKGKEAARVSNKLAGADAEQQQLIMAKITGQFKFGNERAAKNRRDDR
jgi:hypothetical protein